jgi:SOS response regulatory protein OraA/RecX
MINHSAHFIRIMNKECYTKAIRLLSQRDYSRPKLKKKLIDSGYESLDAAEVVNKLYEDGYLKEQWYIEGRIKAFMRKGYSPSHIQQRLSHEELRVELCFIESLFLEHGFSENQQMLDMLERKASRWLTTWADLEYQERQKIKAKLVRSMTAKGFQPGFSLKAIDNFFSTN